MEKLQVTPSAVPVKLSKEKFMKDFSVSRCNVLFEKVSKLEQIFENKTPSLAIIRKDYGKEFIILYLTTWIININEFLNVKSKMNNVQTEETARLISKEFYVLTVTDIHFVFENAKQGRYGKFYDRLDGSMILEWFRNHFTDRCNVYEKKLLQEHLQLKESRMNYEENLTEFIRKNSDKVKT